MRIILFTLLVLMSSVADAQRIEIVNDSNGSRLTVDGTPFFLNGMNWDYFPIGKNYTYSLWEQPDDVIRAALDNEMSLMRRMGVNVIRQYTTIPPRWIQYIYEKYGIYTMINHSFGRYGLTVDGTDYNKTLYCKDDVKEELLRQAEDFVNTYKGTPGVLLYLLGNENNYGLFWSGAESEDLPVSDSLSDKEARCMYELLNEATRRIKAVDPSRPVAICNGDLLFLDIIADVCKDVDILGINCYRGDSFDALFKDVREKYGKPVLLTEFGADAFNAITQRETQWEQAEILLCNWQEIYLNAAGMGQSDNCIGGFTFQFSDGWWKCGQKKNLSVHDTNASWANGGYKFDYVKGENNMNEEWFGICAKGKPDSRGLYELYPRMAYEVLREVHRVDPYQSAPSSLEQHFRAIRERKSNNQINKKNDEQRKEINRKCRLLQD